MVGVQSLKNGKDARLDKTGAERADWSSGSNPYFLGGILALWKRGKRKLVICSIRILLHYVNDVLLCKMCTNGSTPRMCINFFPRTLRTPFILNIVL